MVFCPGGMQIPPDVDLDEIRSAPKFAVLIPCHCEAPEEPKQPLFAVTGTAEQ